MLEISRFYGIIIRMYLIDSELQTARINKEWGCLEFKDGAVDIEPVTLYKYRNTHDKGGMK